MALATAIMPFSWPTTLFPSLSSILMSFSFSPSINLTTGMCVHLAMTSAISSLSTSSLSIFLSFWSPVSFLFSSSSFFSSSIRVPYFSSAALERSPSRSATWAWDLADSSFSFISPIFAIAAFSCFQCPTISSVCDFRSFSSFSSLASLSLDALSFSFFRASLSISIWVIFLCISSISAGMLSISILNLEVASSIRSMALSGRNRSVIYLWESVAAATRAESFILTPWCTSYFSFSPRRMEMVSSTVGSSTMTGWNLLSRAASFSICFLYSLMVVAPTHLSSPLANAGFSMLDASTAPSAAPAPTRVCISSMNNMISPRASVTSLRTALNLSSNSPLYLAPAIRAPMSSATTLLSLSVSGTSP